MHFRQLDRGELTRPRVDHPARARAVVAAWGDERDHRVFALGFTVFRSVIDKPGEPPGEIGITAGWWIGLVGGLLIMVGSVARTKEAMTTPKPPGLP